MNIYDYFGDIVCINLDISVERRKHAEYYFNKLDIPGKFFITKKHPKGGLYGCFDSHVKILKDAYDRGLDNILIFEDDFLPSASYSSENMIKAIDFMETNTDWDIFHFGYCSVKDDNINGMSTIFDGIKYSSDIIQYNPFFTQALCYNKRAIKKIVETYEDYIGIIHYDMYISSYLDFKNYCFIPMLFDQNFNFEHNNESLDIIEYIGRGLFPLLAYTKLNYRISLLMYNSIKYKKYKIYFILFIVSILLYYIKNIILYKKIYNPLSSK